MNKFDKKCSKCKNYNGNILICESCAHYIPKQTVFYHITRSLEALADKLVFYEEDIGMDGKVSTHWTSNVIQRSYSTREEAVTATIDALNEPREKEDVDGRQEPRNS